MAWNQRSRYPRFLPIEDNQGHLKVNSQCFIRKTHKCGKLFGASKSCFIACPSGSSIAPILTLMSDKLTKAGVEPIIAIKDRAYGEDIFCTKICGKIIEARFCIVILDDISKGGKYFPNPNVYYEYGLMTSLKKLIIPLQKKNQKLAFNIQSYDTVKYSRGNISSELDRAIKDAIRISESSDLEKEEQKSPINDRMILRRLELGGFELKEQNWFLNDVIEDTKFRGFGLTDKRCYLYLGKISLDTEFKAHIEDLDIVLYRTEKKARELEGRIQHLSSQIEVGNVGMGGLGMAIMHTQSSPMMKKSYTMMENEKEIAEARSRLKLMEKIYVGFIIGAALNPEQFIKKCQSILGKYTRYELVYSVNDVIDVDGIKIDISESTS